MYRPTLTAGLVAIALSACSDSQLAGIASTSVTSAQASLNGSGSPGTVLIYPEAVSLNACESFQFEATFLNNGDHVRTRDVTWSSLDQHVAEISGTGLLRAMRAGGPVSIVATSGPKGNQVSDTASVTVTVDEPFPGEVTVYDNGIDPRLVNTGWANSQLLIAADFTLESSQTITGVVAAFSLTLPAGESVEWRIMSGSNTPGAVLASGTSIAYPFATAGTAETGYRCRHQLSIGPLALDAGVYWLSLKNPSGNWAGVAPGLGGNTTRPVYVYSPLENSWRPEPDGGELDFQIVGQIAPN
jgi:Big-like domain-containing protein